MAYYTLVGGKINTVKLEYNATAHCNYACAHCQQFAPHNRKSFADLDRFAADLAALSAVYHVRRFRFVGGEPLLHPRLADLAAAVRSSAIADRIQVVTNGSLVDRVDDAVFGSIDMLSISRYADPRCGEDKIRLARQKCEQWGVALEVNAISHFRKAEVRQAIESPELAHRIYASCEMAHIWDCQTFHEGRFYICSRPIFLAQFLKGTHGEVPSFAEVDGIPLHEPNLLERLRALHDRREPWISCRYCLGSVGREFPWTTVRGAAPPASAAVADDIDGAKLARLLRWRRLELVLRCLPLPLSLWRRFTMVRALLLDPGAARRRRFMPARTGHARSNTPTRRGA
jgi:hypothetical protein